MSAPEGKKGERRGRAGLVHDLTEVLSTQASGLTRPSIVFVGNATQDSVYFVPHLPSNDEVCAVDRHVACLGGRGVVPALVAGALGARAALCTVIGSDLSDEFQTFLDSHGVGTTGIKWDTAGRSTTQYVAFIGEATGESVAVALSPQLDWTATETQRQLVADAPAVYFSTNDLGFNLSLLSCVRPKEQVIVHNLGVRIDDPGDYVEAMLSKTTILIGNRVEISRLAQITSMDPREILTSSASLSAIIVTKGRDDLLVFAQEESEPYAFPSRAIAKVVSPVGAGDALAAGVIMSLTSGQGLDDGLALGVELGALAVESELSYPDLVRVSMLAS